MAELTVVMPVYNEEGAIAGVLEQWSDALRGLGIDYQIVVYNDGSKDNTLSILQKANQYDSRVVVVDQPNSGHGPTILKGYCDYGDSHWIFQVDSDGELGPEQFGILWEIRESYDFLIGRRVGRLSPWPRKLTTGVSRYLIWLFYGGLVYDVNCPYRLFQPAKLKDHLHQIPPDTFAPNLIISGLCSILGLRVYQTEVVHTERTTGEVSIKKFKLLGAALSSFRQTVEFRLRTKTH